MTRLILIGHIVRDAEVKIVSGKQVLNFPILRSEMYKTPNGETRKKNLWVECSLWTEKADELSLLLTKNKVCYVDGQPEIKENRKGDGGAMLFLKVDKFQVIRENGCL